jgi:hypothetical protein
MAGQMKNSSLAQDDGTVLLEEWTQGLLCCAVLCCALSALLSGRLAKYPTSSGPMPKPPLA